MSLADQFAVAPSAKITRKGPIAACDIYGPGDTELHRVLHTRRNNGETWIEVQAVLDQVLAVEKKIHIDKFRYHWNGKCSHWDGIDL